LQEDDIEPLAELVADFLEVGNSLGRGATPDLPGPGATGILPMLNEVNDSTPRSIFKLASE
jgi:hypothetical protein